MSSSLPIFSQMNSLLMFVILLLWLPWHLFMFNSFCTSLLPLFPHVLLQPKALFQTPSPYISFLPFHRLSVHNQHLPYLLFLFLSHFLTHLCSFPGLVFIVQLLEVLAFVFPIARALLYTYTYTSIYVHTERYNVYKYVCHDIFYIYI